MTEPAALEFPLPVGEPTPHVPGSWERFRKRLRPFRSWTLRSRIVFSVVALLAVVSLLIGAVSIFTLQAYLIDRLDYQLHGTVERGTNIADQTFGAGPIDQRIGRIVSVPGQPVGTLGLAISGQQVLYAQVLSDLGSSHQVTANLSELRTLTTSGIPKTVNLGSQLGDYRVIASQLQDGDVIIIGLPLSEVNATIARTTLVILIITVAGILFAAFLGTFIVRLTLRPLERVARTALEVSEMPLDRGDVALSIRVPESDTDVHTEVGKVGSALNRMLGHVGLALAARQASEKKVRQFVADASHELRTPLASIRGYAELTRRSPHELPDDVVHSIGRIESEATRMTSLVEDLLLLARLDEGRDLESRPVDLSILLVDTVSDAHAAGRDHRWSLDLPDEPVEVPGDKARLHQVVANLLANARIHTPEGTEVRVALTVLDAEGNLAAGTIGVDLEGEDSDSVDIAGVAGEAAGVDVDEAATVDEAGTVDEVGTVDAVAGYDEETVADVGPSGDAITTVPDLTGQPRAVITISDTGPGIPPDIAPTLFERFVRGDSSRTRATGSTGLGLAIVQAVVDAHRGVVSVSSEPGHTVFRVELPLVAQG